MRLLNTETHRLVDFTGKHKPPYAILSHCWEEGEVSFRHMYESRMVDEEQHLLEYGGEDETFAQEFPLLAEMQRYHMSRMTARRGWQKIVKFCKVARRRGFEYAWIDTCCIDKSSSSELQEAINSMWAWYADAGICLVYMNDVGMPESADEERMQRLYADFQVSRWFTRGWTLQELLAPQFGKILFLDGAWSKIGSDQTLVGQTSKATRIPEQVLTDRPRSVSQACVAEKMSWASMRRTTREEDRAYCLLGLFKISMPLLYGEGGKAAFMRLQAEIMQSIDDESILAWSVHNPRGWRWMPRVLAEDVHQFSIGGLSRVSLHNDKTIPRQPLWMTNRGLQIELSLMEQDPQNLPEEISRRLFGDSSKKFFIAPLKVRYDSRDNGIIGQTVFIPIEMSSNAQNGKVVYSRLPGLISYECDWQEIETLYPRQQIILSNY